MPLALAQDQSLMFCCIKPAFLPEGPRRSPSIVPKHGMQQQLRFTLGEPRWPYEKIGKDERDSKNLCFLTKIPRWHCFYIYVNTRRYFQGLTRCRHHESWAATYPILDTSGSSHHITIVYRPVWPRGILPPFLALDRFHPRGTWIIAAEDELCRASLR